ncbi:MAG: dephospho-CoA kinase [Pseudomonadota bacterium]|nr:dephospho-CoA kinase [Pseudomonadota bacterium]
MKWIGLTGGIGSGKTTVAKNLDQMGVAVVYADQLARDATQVGSLGLESIKKKFGSEMVNSDGSLNRQALGKIVFSDKEKLKTVEQILHPLIAEKTKEIRSKLESQGRQYAIYDVPLLFEKKLEKQFDQIVLVYCEEKVQRERIFKRDLLSADEIELRIRSQMPLREKITKSDFVIYNGGTIEDLLVQTKELLEYLNKKCP